MRIDLFNHRITISKEKRKSEGNCAEDFSELKKELSTYYSCINEKQCSMIEIAEAIQRYQKNQMSEAENEEKSLTTFTMRIVISVFVILISILMTVHIANVTMSMNNCMLWIAGVISFLYGVVASLKALITIVSLLNGLGATDTHEKATRNTCPLIQGGFKFLIIVPLTLLATALAASIILFVFEDSYKKIATEMAIISWEGLVLFLICNVVTTRLRIRKSDAFNYVSLIIAVGSFIITLK